MVEFDPSKLWFHGSRQELAELRVGSTITQDRELARVFSHKPRLVSIGDDGTIKHNGRVDGFLYTIDETVRVGDVEPVPGSTMEPGKEWLTIRPLKVALIKRTTVVPEERLSRREQAVLFVRLVLRKLLTWRVR